METSIIILFVFFLYGCFKGGRLNVVSVSANERFSRISFLVTFANPEAKRLYEELIKVRSYNKLIRPVKNNSETLTVYLGLRLTQLLDVVGERESKQDKIDGSCHFSQDEKNQIMTSNVWLKQVRSAVRSVDVWWRAQHYAGILHVIREKKT